MSEKVSPLSFGNKGVVSPLIFHNQKSSDILVITAEAEGGKYVKAGMLYYNFNGVEIWADLDCSVVVNKLEKSFTVRRVENQLPKVAPENQQYVLLFYPDDDDMDRAQWVSVEGRENAYEWIKSMIGNGYDPDSSNVLAENVAVAQALTMTEFVKYLKNSNLVPEDDFDILDYRLTTGDDEEDGADDSGDGED